MGGVLFLDGSEIHAEHELPVRLVGGIEGEKGALDTLRQWSPLLVLCGKSERRKMWDRFLRALGAHVVPHRPGRAEPRAIKTRPKNYPLLTSPRHEYVEILHRSKYRKSKLALS